MDTTERLSENSRLGFKGLKAAFCPGSRGLNSNAAPGLRPRLRRKGVRTRCSGKKRDNETGLDYFGARYFSSTLGRFTRPDPLYSSGRPTNPQTWNRYAYVLNNPLRYTDPFGLWEWDTCEAGDSVCEEWKKMFEAGIADARKAAKSDRLTKAQQADLQEVLDYLGTAGDGNGVKISFGNIKGTARGELTGINQIKIDMAGLIADSTKEYFGYKYNLTAEIGGVGVHEGRHGISGDYLSYPKNQLERYLGDRSVIETKAYTSQSFVFMGLGVSSSVAPFRNMETTGYSAVDIDTVRSLGIERAVNQNIEATRKWLIEKEGWR